LVIISMVIASCESEPHESNWVNDGALTISQYLNKNQDEYSKFHRLLTEGKLLGTLYAYNPKGEGYTLFLPTDEAIDQFIQKNQQYGSFEDLLKDTSFIKTLTRYHTINKKIKADELRKEIFSEFSLLYNRVYGKFFFSTVHTSDCERPQGSPVKSLPASRSFFSCHLYQWVATLANSPPCGWL